MLTPDQLIAIDCHLRHGDLLTNEALLLELNDHFATAVTERIGTGESFDGALMHVQETFGGWPGLWAMQEQYARGQNRVARATFRQVAWSYLTLPRVLITLSLAT